MIYSSKTRNAMLAFLLGFVLSASAWAQTATGTVTGTVKDATGAIIPGVEVTVTKKATGTSRSTITGDSGLFRLTSVPAGPYHAEAKLTGFKTATAEFELDVAAVQTVNFVLEVGDLTEIVDVTESVTEVNVQTGTLSSVVQERQVQDLPLNGRNVFQLALLQPGVTQGINDGIGGTAGINASGNRVRGNNFSLDGVSNNDPISGGFVSITPNVDIVQEFRIQNNNFSAEYGRNNGAIINVITKSGTNEFHGTAYEFHRNDALDAREVFDTTDRDGDGKADIAPLRQHQFGFTLGGPVVRNRTFFFVGYEGFRTFSGESVVRTFETKAFRDLVQQKFPGTTQAKLFQAYPAPVEPNTGLVDTGSPSIEFLTPGPRDGILDRGRISLFSPAKFESNQYNIRVDHEFSENNKLFGRWVANKGENPGPHPRADELGDKGDFFAGNAIVSETHIFSPTVVNEFRMGYNRARSDYLVLRYDITDVTIAGSDGIVGFGAYGGEPQFFTAEEYHLVDVVSINKGNHGIKTGFEYRWNQDDSDFQFLTRGYMSYEGMFDFAANLPYYAGARVDPRATGRLPLVGTPHNFRQSEWAVFFQDDWKLHDRFTLNLGLRYDNYGQISDTQGRLANLKFGQGRDVFERVMKGTVGRVDSDGIFKKDNNNFSPRIGFAWDLFGDGKTSLRGGFGVAYDRLFLNVTGNIRFNPPDSAGVGLYAVDIGGALGSDHAGAVFLGQALKIPFPFVPLIGKGFNPGGGPLVQVDLPGGNGPVIGGRISLRSPDPSMRQSYSMNWFFGIQRELFWDMLFEANYVGNGGRKLGFIEHYNRYSGNRFGFPNPYTGKFEGIFLNPWFLPENLRTNNVNSSYHGGNVSVQKRFSRGLSFQSAFTFGKVLDTNSDNFGSNASSIFSVDPSRWDLEWGLAGYDVSKRWASNFIYEIPFLKEQQGILGEVLGGWQVQGIFAFQDGPPYTPQAFSSAHDYNGDFRSNDRPNGPSGGSAQYHNLSVQRYIQGVFGSTATEARNVFLSNGGMPGDCDGNNRPGGPRGVTTLGGKPCGGIGTMGRSLFRQPGYANVDFSLFKHFRVPWFTPEGAKVQFRAEFFNMLNRVNLGAVQRNFVSSTFGKVTSALDAREIQLALKFIF